MQLVEVGTPYLHKGKFTRGKGLLHTITGAIKLVVSLFSCLSILLRRRPDVVLGMGGYVTVPGGVVAKVCGVPLALVNADAALLMSNKALLPFAKKVLFGFATQGEETDKKMQVTGNPVCVHKSHVNHAACQGLELLDGVQLCQLNLYFGKRQLKFMQAFRQPTKQHRTYKTDAHPAGDPCSDFAHLQSRRIRLHQHTLGRLTKSLTRRRQTHTMAVANEQLCAQ